MQKIAKSAFITGLEVIFSLGVGLVFLFLGEYVWAAAAFLLSYLPYGAFRASLKPWEDEKLFLRLLGDLNGNVTAERLEEALEEYADTAGVYSGEVLEDLHLAYDRLVEKRRIKIEHGMINIA